MRLFLLSIAVLSCPQSWAARSCATPLALVDRAWDFRTVVPRHQLAWRGRPDAHPTRDRELRLANPPILDVTVSPDGRRALASFRTGEVVLFGDFEPNLLYTVPPIAESASEFNILAPSRLSWFDDAEFVASREVRRDNSAVDRILTRGRIEADGSYVELNALELNDSGMQFEALRDGLYFKADRSREAVFMPRDFDVRAGRLAKFDLPERPIALATPSRKRLALLDWFLTRRTARLYFWDPRTNRPPELALDFSATQEPTENIPDITSVRAIDEKHVAIALKNHYMRPRLVADGVYVYGKKLVRQKEFEPTEALLAVSDRGRLVLTRDQSDAKGGELRLWRARGKTFELAHALGRHEGSIEKVRLTETPARIWIFDTTGILRLIDFGDAK